MINIMLFIIYLATRLFQLNLLPVFSDEAIYIRWASMILADPKQYFFLPLYDGKSPLFIWLLTPIIKLFSQDPVLGSRLLTVFFGSLILITLSKIIRELGGRYRTQVIGSIVYITLPFSFFFDRIGLIDTPLTFMLAMAYYYALRWQKKLSWKYAILTGIWWGIALLTKTSGLYALPIFGLIGLFTMLKSKNKQAIGLQLLVSGMIGFGMLAWLRISPLFPFLFNRSADFTYPLSQILSDPISIIFPNLITITDWLWRYLNPIHWVILGITIGAMVVNPKKIESPIKQLVFMGIIFLVPFIITGKLLNSRYLLPAIIWFIPAYSFAIDYWWSKKRIFGFLILASVFIYSIRFAIPLYSNFEHTLLSDHDRGQYLKEWSAGFGIPEVRDVIKNDVENKLNVYVGTEGSFGTLPDGLYIYFLNPGEENQVRIEGLGVPIISTPSILFEMEKNYDRVYLLANKNRITYDYSGDLELVKDFNKPEEGFPLLLLRLKERDEQ